MNDQISKEESVEIDNKLVEDIIEDDKGKFKKLYRSDDERQTSDPSDASYGLCPRDDAPDFCQCPCCSNCRPIKARKCCSKCTRTSSTQSPNICKYCMLITTDRKCPFLQHKDIRDMLCHGHSYSDSEEEEATPPFDPINLLTDSLGGTGIMRPFSLGIPPSFLEDKPKSLLDPKYKRNPTNLKDLLDLYTFNSVEKNLNNNNNNENKSIDVVVEEEDLHSDILLEKLGKIESNNESEEEKSNDDDDDDDELIDPEISNLLKQNPPNNLYPYSTLLSDENMNDDDINTSPFHSNWDNSGIYSDLQFNMFSGVCKASISVEDLGIDEVYNKFMNKVSKFISDELQKEVNDDEVGVEIENKVGKFEPED